jgi:hypothetical protein
MRNRFLLLMTLAFCTMLMVQATPVSAYAGGTSYLILHINDTDPLANDLLYEADNGTVDYVNLAGVTKTYVNDKLTQIQAGVVFPDGYLTGAGYGSSFVNASAATRIWCNITGPASLPEGTYLWNEATLTWDVINATAPDGPLLCVNVSTSWGFGGGLNLDGSWEIYKSAGDFDSAMLSLVEGTYTMVTTSALRNASTGAYSTLSTWTNSITVEVRTHILPSGTTGLGDVVPLMLGGIGVMALLFTPVMCSWRYRAGADTIQTAGLFVIGMVIGFVLIMTYIG